jgi:hypothetical protein
MGTLESIVAQLVAQGYSPEEARRRAEAAMLLGAAPPDVVFGAPPATATDALPSPGPAGRPVPSSQAEYDQMMEAYNSGKGMLPMDGYETEGEVRQRYDAKFGRGAYGKYLMEREARGEIEIDPATGEPRRIGGYFAKPGRKASPVTANVDDNLQASAAPIAMEPMVGVKTPPAASAMDPDDPSTWDAGYEEYVRQNTPAEPTNSVERVDRYFADKKRAPLQSREEFVGALSRDYHRRRGEKAMDTYGFGPDRTAEQQAAVDERAAVERRAANTGRAEELRIARLAEKAGITYDEAREQYLAAKSNLSPNAGIAPDGLMTPEGIRLATESLRGLARDQQAARRRELRERNQRRGMLAGSNVRANEANAIAAMSDEDVAEVVRARMLPPGVAAAEAQAGVEGVKLGIQGKEADARLAAIEAGIDKARADYQLQRDEFSQRQKQWDAEQTERKSRLEQDAADRAGERNQFLETLKSQHAKDMAELQVTLAGVNNQSAGLQAKIEADAAKQRAEQDLAKRGMEMSYQKSNPGLYDIIAGRGTTEAAIRELKGIASRSDNFQWLAGGGFGEREATAMNDELLGLARQAELLGMPTRLNDPAYRRELIKKWGYASGWSGGRGGWFGDFWQPMPEGL